MLEYFHQIGLLRDSAVSLVTDNTWAEKRQWETGESFYFGCFQFQHLKLM